MGRGNDAEVSKLPPGDSPVDQTTGPICSLSEAWLHTLDRCVVDTSLSELILEADRK
jgi:hypothetical protein